MLMAQALALHWLGRHWRVSSDYKVEVTSMEAWKQQRLHRAILRVPFLSPPDDLVLAVVW